MFVDSSDVHEVETNNIGAASDAMNSLAHKLPRKRLREEVDSLLASSPQEPLIACAHTSRPRCDTSSSFRSFEKLQMQWALLSE